MPEVPDLIILISGKRKCGKEALAKLIYYSFNGQCELLRLFEPVKKHFAMVLNCNKDDLLKDESTREQIRRDMVLWCEEQQRNVSEFVFCKQVVENVMRKHRNNPRDNPIRPIWIVAGCRRHSDLEYFYNNFDCKIITIRIWSFFEVRSYRSFQYNPEVDDAESECGLDTYEGWDFIVENNCSHTTSSMAECECEYNSKFLDSFTQIYDRITVMQQR